MLGKTPWVDRGLRQTWSRIASRVPESWLPTREADLSAVEYGCGHYGCVMPTSEPGLVCKLTSDPQEANFVAVALSIGEVPSGIVEYKAIYQLGGLSFRKRPIWILWRTEAFKVGLFRTASSKSRFVALGFSEWQWPAYRESESLLTQFLGFGRTAREAFNRLDPTALSEELVAVDNAFNTFDLETRPDRYKSAARVGAYARHCYDFAMQLQNTDVLTNVGEALGFYMDNGLLMADVHLGNIGLDADDSAIITDPGHAIPIAPQWAQPPVIETI